MPPSTLFPLDREPFQPSNKLNEPVVWLRRVVILSAPEPAAEIRNIEFRKGLNIIKTRQMKAQGGPVAGHSVGKTLLIRMIRYTLGEPYFGSEETQQNLANIKDLASACVVAHWTILGTDWIVVRPLCVEDEKASYAVNSDNWQQAIQTADGRLPHRDFVHAVELATISNLPTFTLPRGREAKWLDVLAWLSRDYQCGYRKANEWRHEDARSGPSLDREENGLVMQWLIGLMNADEIDLRLKHQGLLGDRGDKKRIVEREEKKIATLWEPLRDNLGLSADTEVEGEQRSFESIKPVAVVKEKVDSLERLRQDRILASQVADLNESHKQALQRLAKAERAIGECSGLIAHFSKQISEFEADPTKPFARCQADPCWIKERAKKTANDPAKDDHLAELRAQLQEPEEQLREAQGLRKKWGKAAADAKKRLEAEQQRLSDELSGIDQLIGQWKNIEKEAVKFQAITTAATKIAKKLKTADGAVDESLKTLDEMRNKHRSKVKRLSEVYEQILQEIFGPEASGKIQVDGNGLQPVPDKKLAPAGAALSVMTTVLAFDVSCLAAAVYGLGHHPRFVMHDSPREGDMEGPLFRRLFEVVHELEKQFNRADGVSFQYIVTTTSEPPSQLANPKGPYVRETLDATSDDGRLLRRRF